MTASIASSAHLIGLTVHQALWEYPLSVVLQMIHAHGVANGGEYDWTHAGDPSDDILEEFERLSTIEIETFN